MVSFKMQMQNERRFSKMPRECFVYVVMKKSPSPVQTLIGIPPRIETSCFQSASGSGLVALKTLGGSCIRLE